MRESRAHAFKNPAWTPCGGGEGPYPNLKGVQKAKLDQWPMLDTGFHKKDTLLEKYLKSIFFIIVGFLASLSRSKLFFNLRNGRLFFRKPCSLTTDKEHSFWNPKYVSMHVLSSKSSHDDIYKCNVNVFVEC